MAEDPELDDLLGSVEASGSQGNKDDAELSQLLDSALKDFAPVQPSKSSPEDQDSATSGPCADVGGHVPSTASDNDAPHLQELLRGRY